MTVKSSSNIFIWLSVIFVSTMLVLGILLLIKGGLVGRINTSAEDADINNPIDIRIIPFPKFVPNQKDDSLNIRFFAPEGMVEDEEVTKELGVYKVFKSKDARQVHPQSYIVISFSKKKADVPDLENFIFGTTLNLKTIFPDQKLTIGILHLNKEIVKKFEYMRIPYYANLFLIKTGINKPGYNCAVFSFETPDGFWAINWMAPKKILECNGKERSIFLSLIKFMVIEIYNPITNGLEIYM